MYISSERSSTYLSFQRRAPFRNVWKDLPYQPSQGSSRYLFHDHVKSNLRTTLPSCRDASLGFFPSFPPIRRPGLLRGRTASKYVQVLPWQNYRRIKHISPPTSAARKSSTSATTPTQTLHSQPGPLFLKSRISHMLHHIG